MRTPSNFVLMMKFTTPPTASAPYTDEAPPVSSSTRSTSAVGTMLMSEAKRCRAVLRITGAEAAAVDQHQRAVGAEAAQVDGRGAVGAVGDIRALRREHLRQFVDDVFDRAATACAQLLRRTSR